MTGLAAGFRDGLRALVRNPGFAIPAVLLVALGIGANTAIFSVVNGVLLRPLPYASPERLLWLCEESATFNHCTTAPPNAADWSEQSRVLEGVGVVRGWSYSYQRGERADNINVGIATPALFDVLGVAPQLGRWLQPQDQQGEGARVVVLSDTLWRADFAADPGVLGRTITLDGEPHQIVGVAPRGFTVPFTYASTARL